MSPFVHYFIKILNRGPAMLKSFDPYPAGTVCWSGASKMTYKDSNPIF